MAPGMCDCSSTGDTVGLPPSSFLNVLIAVRLFHLRLLSFLPFYVSFPAAEAQRQIVLLL